MSRKKTHEEYAEELANINQNITVLEEYINAKTAILHKCNLDGHIWAMSPNNALNGTGCPMCAGNLKKTTEQYIKEVKNINQNIEVLGEYININTPILHKCKIDEHTWMGEPANILHGKGCPICGNRRTSKLLRKAHDKYVKDVNERNPSIEVIDQYIDAYTPILHKCKIDGCEWMARPHNILHRNGCPKCRESSGERAIRQWLESHNIQYIYQKTFSNCKDIKTLPFDFYLSEYNLCVEYDGEQHFDPIDFAGEGQQCAQEKFKKIQHHDQIKNQYCKNNNIRLLRIPYFKNIEEELNNFLFI